MADVEQKIENLEGKYSDLHTVVNVLAANVNNLTAELRDFKQEMRDRDNRRADEIAALSAATDSKIAEIRNSVDGMGKHIRNLTYTSIGAIAAMVITVLLNLPKG